MNLYKVSFDNNKAVLAAPLYGSPDRNVKVEVVNGTKKVNWITIFADSELEGMRLANQLVAECLKSVVCK